jgi:exopolysaccharide biosynthesis polyprenyl glycosylphosphotransferase
MLYHNVRLVGTHLLVIDAAAFAVFVDAAIWIAAPGAWGVWSETPAALGIHSLIAAIFFLGFGSRLGAYRARRADRLPRELGALAEVTLCTLAFVLVAAELLRVSLAPMTMLWISVFCLGAMLALRLAMRLIIRSIRRSGRDEQVWVVVGSNPRAAALLELVSAHKHFGIRVAAVVDLPLRNGGVEPPPEQRIAGTSVLRLSEVEEIREILEQNVVDDIVITLPVRTYYDEIERIIAIGRESGISIMLPSDAFGRPGHRSELTMTGHLAMVTHFTGPSNYFQLGLKRLIDIVVSLAGLVLLLPLFVVLAVWIKLDSPGSVFFLSPRIGLHGRKFQMVKFRSMVANAPELKQQVAALNETDGVAFKIKNDPRVTRVGRILRSYHLDELTQLWNVLVGDMSLVGPRPLPENEATGREWWHRRRLSMPPGMTCLWQLTGDHKMPFQEWAALDLRYIDNWSVWLDVKLILATLLIIFRRPGW